MILKLEINKFFILDVEYILFNFNWNWFGLLNKYGCFWIDMILICLIDLI